MSSKGKNEANDENDGNADDGEDEEEEEEEEEEDEEEYDENVVRDECKIEMKSLSKDWKKKRKKKKKNKHGKTRGGVASRPIKYLTHPLERSIAAFFVITLFFTLLALITGVPVILTLLLLVPPALLVNRLIACQFRSLASTTVRVSPIESYWLCEKTVNNNKRGISTCLLYLDKGLSVEQLRDVIMTRILQRPEMAKFRSILVYKGLSSAPFWVRLSFEEFAIEKQIVEDCALHSRRDLKAKLLQVMPAALPDNCPQWEIRWCNATYLNQIVLILRVHQSIVDGTSLAKILVEQLADQAPPTTTTFIKTGHGTTTTIGHFKPRFGGLNFAVNMCRAVIVGPLTFALWMYWAFSRRKRNYLKSDKFYKKRNASNGDSNQRSNSVSNSSDKSKHSNTENVTSTIAFPVRVDPFRSIYWTAVDLPKIYRIKQITRSCLNDVILSAISGSVRKYLTSKCKIANPPDLGVSIPVDIRNVNEYDSNEIGVDYVLLTSPLPTNTEGVIPRLWEIRHLMEELKTSADPAVMFGVHYFLTRLLPNSAARFVLNLIHRNSSVCLSNLQGPQQQLTIGSHRLRKIHYWMSPPPNIPITFNVITYDQKLHVSVATTSQLISCGKHLAKFFKEQIDELSCLLSRRRVPGESRLKKKTVAVSLPNHMLEKSVSEANLNATRLPQPHVDLSLKLCDVQQELFKLTEELDAYPDQRKEVSARLEELKEEFSLLMKEIRRRKSIAEYGLNNPLINIDNRLDDDEDIDGELRPAARRFSFASRRSSVVSAIPLPTSTRIQIASPLLNRRFDVSPEDDEYDGDST